MLYGEKLKEICEKLKINREELPDGLYSTLLNAIAENAGTAGENKLPQVIDKTVTEITESDLAGATSIEKYMFSDCSRLTSVVIPNSVTTIGEQAFSNCPSLTNLVLPKEITAIGNSAFTYCRKVANFNHKFNISTLGQNAFCVFGSTRTTPANSIITMDFSGSSFNEIPYQSFGQVTSSSDANKYMILKFPPTVTLINGYAFYYNQYCEYYFLSPTPPTAGSNVFSTSQSNKYFVPWNSINAYKTATYWSANAVKNYIKGFSPANTFTKGQKLPEYNAEGYALTWYSDKKATTAVTTVEDSSAEYYCVAGTERVGANLVLKNISNANIVVSDGTKNYQNGDLIQNGTSVTISWTVIDESLSTFVYVNGTAVANGGSITVNGEDIVIQSLYEGERIAKITGYGSDVKLDTVEKCVVGMNIKVYKSSGAQITDTGVRTITAINAESYRINVSGTINGTYFPSGGEIRFTSEEATA